MSEIITTPFVINLPESYERRNRMISIFNQHNIIPRWFQGVKFELKESGVCVANSEKQIHFGKIDRVNLSELGCIASHLEIIKQAKKENLPNVWIMEDDIDFADLFWQNFDVVISQLPSDWEMLYLGANHQAAIEVKTSRLAICKKMFTTHCYLINNQIFDEIINNINSEQPIDVFYNKIHARGKSYTATPSLCWQVSGYSYIENAITTNREQVTRII